MKFLEVHHSGLKNRWRHAIVSKRNVIKSVAEEAVPEEGDVLEKKKRRTSKRTTSRTTKIGETENPENVSVSVINRNLSDEENMTTSESSENSYKTRRCSKNTDTSATSLYR
ncbi:hypothetical protein ACH5RR_037040 [Cinchona calisaya]|uniref:Uncharacterized protein n=1 Tax=Cinchona calisaya TaxID=153742 RepID=A0ABD2Y6D2_9GENT